MKRIKLTKGKTALIDDEDFDLVSKASGWVYAGAGYAMAYVPGASKTIRTPVYMHRLIMNFPKSHIDHINGNPLDNRKVNLRLASPAQNTMNARNQKNSFSKFKGVSWHKKDRAWCVGISVHGKRTYLGRFRTEHQAALVYDLWAKDLFGEFARLNFVPVIIN